MPYNRLEINAQGNFVNRVLLKIHVITGWVIPRDELFLILIEQFSKKMEESYSFLNEDEFEYAFRHFGSNVKDWGKSLNISIVDEVMRPFIEKRSSILKFIDQNNDNLLIEYEPTPMSDEEKDEWIADVESRYTTEGVNVMLIPPLFYDRLIARGENLGVKSEIWKQAVSKMLSDSINKMNGKMNEWDRKKEQKKAEFLQSGGKDNRNEFYNEIVGMAKRLSVCFYFENKKSQIDT